MLQAPPCILLFFRVKLSKSIYPSHFQEIIEAFSLLWSKAGLFIGKGSKMNIYLVMANIKISTYNNALSQFSQFLAIFMKGFFIDLGFVMQSFKFFISGTRNIHGNKIEVLKFQGQNPSFLTISRLIEILNKRNWQKLREDRNSRVSCRDFAEIPISTVPFKLNWILIEQFFIDFCLINAKDIRLNLINEVKDGIFIENASYPINIPHCKLYYISSTTFSSQSFIWCLFFESCTSRVQGLLNKFTSSDFWGRLTHLHRHSQSMAVLKLQLQCIFFRADNFHPHLAKRMRKSSVPAFIEKTWEMLQRHQHEAIVHWSRDGTSFQILNEELFCSELLPQYFRHSNFSSFIRQLNMYNFHKRKSSSSVEFYHELFRRDQKQLLAAIKRKPSQAEIIQGQQLIRKLVPQFIQPEKAQNQSSGHVQVKEGWKENECQLEKKMEEVPRQAFGMLGWAINGNGFNTWSTQKKVKTTIILTQPTWMDLENRGF